MRFIGVIDSGVGGLTVLQRLRQSKPCNYVYIADHAFCPYGTKTNEMVYSRASKLVDYLKSQGAQAVVLACNTMSCFAHTLQRVHNLPIYDVISPTCKYIADVGVQKVALLATKSTIANGAYQTILASRGIQTAAFDCSAFVPFVERRATTSAACRQAVDKALCNLPQTKPDAVILGCTHFPLLRSLIARYCADGIIVESRCDLTEDIVASCDLQDTVRYFTTGDADLADYAAGSVKNDAIRFKSISLP